MKKPSPKQVEKAKQILRSAGYATRALWHLHDVEWVIETEENPERYSHLTDEAKLCFLEDVLEQHCQDINESIEFNLEDML